MCGVHARGSVVRPGHRRSLAHPPGPADSVLSVLHAVASSVCVCRYIATTPPPPPPRSARNRLRVASPRRARTRTRRAYIISHTRRREYMRRAVHVITRARAGPLDGRAGKTPEPRFARRARFITLPRRACARVYDTCTHTHTCTFARYTRDVDA